MQSVLIQDKDKMFCRPEDANGAGGRLSVPQGGLGGAQGDWRHACNASADAFSQTSITTSKDTPIQRPTICREWVAVTSQHANSPARVQGCMQDMSWCCAAHIDAGMLA